MSQLLFHFLSFEESLSTAHLQFPSADALFIFPTEAGKRAAIREFQRQWEFDATQFLTMEEWKEGLLDSDKPLLKEEKRTLAFYAALTDEDKALLKIGNYFQSIEPAQHFFDLWEEFNEELLADELDQARLLAADADLLSWQKLTYDALLKIKRQYHNLIESKGFSDAVFLLKPELLNLGLLQDVRRVYFVNQFYYTTLEKNLINRLVELGKEVTLIYQLPPALVDQKTLEIRPFTVQDLGNCRNESIDIVECHNDATMLTALLQRVEKEQVRHVVNYSEHREPHSRFLSPAGFHIAAAKSFEETSIFQFFRSVHLLVSTLFLEPNHRKILLPLQSCLDVLLDEHFCRFVFREDQALRQQTLDDLYSLVEDQYQFIDIDGHFFHTMRKRACEPAMRKVFSLIQSVIAVRSIDEWIALIDGQSGIVVDDLVTAEEKTGTELRETFYRALADFRSLQQVGIIDDWEALFHNRYLPPQAQTAAGILKLFLDYLKSRQVRRRMTSLKNPRVEFTTLQDTRNLSYKNVAIMNVVEKEIPHARRTPFLFTEKQRRVLGLKTYEDIILREKYYLMRLVFTTPRVILLTQRNMEQNIEVSSFVEEIKLLYDPRKLLLSAPGDVNYAELYSLLMKPDFKYQSPVQAANALTFYTLSFDLQRDLPTRSLDLSHYSLNMLLTNPFVFYIRHLARVPERVKVVTQEISAKLLGQIVHEILNQLWQSIGEQNPLPPFQTDFSAIPQKLIDDAVSKTLRTDKFFYLLPHNHSEIYFREIILPQIQDGIRGFLNHLHQIGLSHTPLKIFPEKIEPSLREPYVTFLPSDKMDFQVRIGGRADLRIEAAEKQRFYIFDYKTGAYQKEQLILYELYYYLAENPQLAEHVDSFFYQILKEESEELRQSAKKKNKAEILAQFEAEVKDAVRAFWLKGFGLPEKKSALVEMPEITRRDLYESRMHGVQNPFGSSFK